MKKVVLEKPSIIVSVDKYYGILTKDSLVVGFITRERFQRGRFIVRCMSKMLTDGNGWFFYRSNDLLTTVKKIVNDGFHIFEFDTAKELFIWMASKM